MTEPCTERLHRRVNWPPGSCHPPDRGRTLTKHPQQPGRQSAVNSARIHTPSLSESYSMTVFIKERFSRRVYWPPGSWHPPDRRSTLTDHPQQPCQQSAQNSARIQTLSLSESYSTTVFITERFRSRFFWPPGSWHPPNRRSSLSFWSETARYYSWVAPTCNHNFTSIHFQELNP